jgi:hypothetical protein
MPGGINMNMLLFMNLLQTFLLLFIAAGTTYLVYRSSRSVKGTRKSLSSRRQDIYSDVVRILTMLGKTGEIRKEDLLDFRSRTQDAPLLFDTDIAGYIDEIYNRGVKLTAANEILRSTLPVGEERDRITVEHAKQTIWLADQLARIGKKFEQYPDVR